MIVLLTDAHNVAATVISATIVVAGIKSVIIAAAIPKDVTRWAAVLKDRNQVLAGCAKANGGNSMVRVASAIVAAAILTGVTR